MRIIHTADWHLGHSLNGWSRELEHEVFFARLADLIDEQQADLLVVAGDVFDSSNPSGETQELFYRTLARFKQRRPGLVTVISGGNHDPALRLEAPSPVLKALDVHVVGTVKRRDREIDMSRLLVPVTASGEVALYVLAIPFLRASDLTGLSFGDTDEQSPVVRSARAFFEEVTEKARAVAGGVPILAMAHLHCAGGLESEGAERRILIGGSHALPVDVFPDSLAYVALGHLHGQQTLGDGRVRYSGSCFPLSASEINYAHGVTLIEIADGRASHHHIAIAHPAPVLRVPRSGQIALADLAPDLDAIEVDGDGPMGLRPIVYVELEATDAAAVLMSDAATMVAERGLRLGGVRVHRTAPAARTGGQPMISLRQTTPEQLFIDAYSAKNDVAPEERHLSAFRDILVEG